ncbi:uncharacterized protein LOC122567202 isoform X4 [Bombus pyrosoma]|uniref:uncharacterized protein LOC122567202 isoform X4 n=1 Tax=Bombus pyrosoma TaxID=396416 RepID=UPI001CB8C77C|nr:uncharacterized protein LOC122567202 isoform X4 [Bombus pyrosoma]
MEIMEDGNLVDRVRILLQRDMQYYQEMQTVLKEPLCSRISGGKLDFPRHASFVAVKIVTWWEADFQAAFNRHSGLTSLMENKSSTIVENEERVIKKISPSEFVLLVVDTADKLLEHLHLLIQESLDHADLTVLTATLGAAALIRNCLWCYNRQAKNLISPQSSEKLNTSYKCYHEMAEAVAERLLDLHCRLISLYILNEADSLSWHDTTSFFERERCSFVIQMWWLYMQGTKRDLWSTVSPKMAQRVFSGMLNESLSIIVTRFIYGRPSLARSEQFWTDAFNVLCCTGYLALGACASANEMIGVKLNRLPTAIRDIHAKCNELLICLLLRGTPLRELYQVLFMNDYAVAKILLNTLIYKCGNFTSKNDFDISEELQSNGMSCGGFLCSGIMCNASMKVTSALGLYSLMYILTYIAQDPGCVIVTALKQIPDWSSYLDRQQVWNQSRPPWLNAILSPLKNMMHPIIEILLEAVRTGASMYQAMSLVIGCFAELYVTLPPAILKTVLALQDNIPAHCHPIGGNVLLHVLCASLYTALIEFSKTCETKIHGDSTPEGIDYLELNHFDPNDVSATVTTLAEAICSIDEDDKHTSQIDDFFQLVKKNVQTSNIDSCINETCNLFSVIEVHTDELLFTSSGRQALKVTHEFLIRASDLILNKLRQNDITKLVDDIPDMSPLCKPLTHIMFHIEDTTFDQFLIQYEKTNWRKMLTMPLSITIDHARSQLLSRPEFKNVGELIHEDREAACSLKKLCSSIKTAHFK